MAWTATIGEATKAQGVVSITVTLTDSVSGEVIRKTFQDPNSLELLKTSVRNYVTQITNSYASFGVLPAVGQVLDYSATAASPSVYGMYTVSSLAMVKAANKHYLSLFNADSVLVVDIIGVKITQELTAAVVGFARGYRLFKTTAHSGGTLLTPEKTDSQWPALSANITARGNGNAATVLGGAVGIASLSEDEVTAGGDTWLFQSSVGLPPITLRQNQGVTVQQDGAAGLGLISAIIYYRVS